MSKLLQDLRYASRQLRNHPGFTVAALLTLALGVAVNTTIFSAVSAVLLRKPAIHHPDRVMTIISTNRKSWNGNPNAPISALDFMALRDNNRSFAEMAAVLPYQSFNLTGGGTPEHVEGMSVSANYFHLLGVTATIGRTFLPEDGQLSSSHVAVISNEFWKTHFAGNPRILGATVKLDGKPYTIVGVMPKRFKLLFTFTADIWVPLVFPADQLVESARASRSFYVFARLKPGVSEDTAQAEITNIAANIQRSHPVTDKNWGAKVLTLQEFHILDAQVRPALIVLLGVVGFVLLIACANIAGLLLGRGAARQQEFAIRTALGANRQRLFRQLFSESLLIAALGAVLGLLFSLAGIRLLHALLGFSDYLSQSWELRIDHRVLLFTLTLSLASTLLFGVLPALKFSKTDPSADLKEAGLGGGAGRSRARSWKALVSGEIALALVLLTAAGLMGKSFVEEMDLYPGFNAKHLLTASIDLPAAKYPDAAKQVAFFTAAVRQINNLPGVESATVAGALPLAADAGRIPVTLKGNALFAKTDTRHPEARSYLVAPDYWQTMQIPLRTGRLLQNSDTVHAPPVAVVNQAFADIFFPKGDAIGQQISVDAGNSNEPTWLQVVGVVGDVKDWIGQPANDPQIYRSFLQFPQAGMILVVRTRTRPTVAASAVQGAIWRIDKDQALADVMTMSKLIDERGAGGDRVMGQLLGTFAVLALLLAAIGIYGIVAFMVTSRTHEIGIRLALGANRRDVLRLILGDGLKLALIGSAPGFAVALLLPRLFGSVFNGFHVNAAAILAGAPAVLLIVAIAATYVPAYRAAKLDPMVALRHE